MFYPLIQPVHSLWNSEFLPLRQFSVQRKGYVIAIFIIGSRSDVSHIPIDSKETFNALIGQLINVTDNG